MNIDNIGQTLSELLGMAKYDLCLAGGGIKGAYQIGALKYLDEKNIKINSITGTSVGAVNGAMIAQGEFEKLEKIYLGLRKREDLIAPWFYTGIGFIDWLMSPFSYIMGFFKGSLYTNKPYVELLEKNLDLPRIKSSNVDFISCSYCFTTGKTHYQHSKQSTSKDIFDFIKASSSFTLGMPVVKSKGNQYTDGGVTEPIPAKYAAKYSKNKTIIILTGSAKQLTKTKKVKNLFNVAMASLSAMFSEIEKNDINMGMLKYWNGNDRTCVIPMEESFFDDSFDVSPEKILKAMDHGYKQAKKHLKGFI